MAASTASGARSTPVQTNPRRIAASDCPAIPEPEHKIERSPSRWQTPGPALQIVRQGIGLRSEIDFGIRRIEPWIATAGGYHEILSEPAHHLQTRGRDAGSSFIGRKQPRREPSFEQIHTEQFPHRLRRHRFAQREELDQQQQRRIEPPEPGQQRFPVRKWRGEIVGPQHFMRQIEPIPVETRSGSRQRFPDRERAVVHQSGHDAISPRE